MKGVLAKIEQNVQCDNLINSSAFVVSKGLNDLFTRSRNARYRDKQKTHTGFACLVRQTRRLPLQVLLIYGLSLGKEKK